MRLNMTLQVTGSEVLKARGISIDMQPIKVDADRLVDLPKVIATCNQDHKHKQDHCPPPGRNAQNPFMFAFLTSPFHKNLEIG